MDKIKDKRSEETSVIRATIEPSIVEGSDFSAVAVPANNKQLRYSYQNEEYFYQVLRTGAENIITERLNSGLPLFDNHPWENSAVNTLGITTGYEFTERGIEIKAKLGARADAALRSDIKDGIIKTVSIEGEIVEYSVERKEGMIPIYYAEKWQPFSLSFAPVPNDIEAQMDVKRELAEQIKVKHAERHVDKSIFKLLTEKF